MILRILAAISVVALAVLITPEMLKPGINSADILVMFAPIAVVAIFAVRRSKTSL